MNIFKNLSRSLLLAVSLVICAAAALSETRWKAQNHDAYGRVLTVAVQGKITSKDADIISKAVFAEPHAPVRLVVLSSEGGDLRAAMQMGSAMREHEFDAVIPQGHACNSACVFLLAAAIDKTVHGTVGIHRPYFVSGDPDRIGEEIKDLRTQSINYFRKMNIPERLAEDMFSVDPGNIRVLTEREIEDYRLNSKDFAAQESDIHRMMGELGMSRQEYEAFRSDLDYYCEVYTGQPARMSSCVADVAGRHGIAIGNFSHE